MIVLGNGESRKNLKIVNAKIGCNAAHREYVLEHLVCVDDRCVQEALASNNTKNTLIYTRKDSLIYYKDSRLRAVPELPFEVKTRPDIPIHWGSGPYAILLASQLYDQIHMVGFDLWSQNFKVNNLYKNTVNYADENATAVDPRYWIYQISRIFLANSNKYFVIFNYSTWTMPSEWNLVNVEFRSLDKLQ